LGAVKNPSDGLTEILAAKTDEEVAEVLLTLPKPDRKTLAKELKAALGGKTAKVVTIGTFTPKTTVLWEKSDIDTVADEFKDYLKRQWRGGQYIQIKR
jgi:acylphosphatase